MTHAPRVSWGGRTGHHGSILKPAMAPATAHLWPASRMVQGASQLSQVQDQLRLSPRCTWSSFMPGVRGPLDYRRGPGARDIRVGPTGWGDEKSGWGPTPASQRLLQLPSRSPRKWGGVALVLPACTLSSTLLGTRLENTVQTSSCNSKVSVEKEEDVTVYFVVQSVPSVSACGGQRFFPTLTWVPLSNQPRQAGTG